MFNYGISTFSVFHLPLEEGIKTLIQKGWKNIEIMCEGPGEEIFTWSSHKNKELGLFFEEHRVNISIHAPITKINMASKDILEMKNSLCLLQKCFQIAEIWQSPYVLSHLGVGEDKKECLELCVQMMGKIIPNFPSLFYIENVPPIKNLVGGDIMDIVYVIDQLKTDKVGVVFDTGHANIHQALSPIEQFQLVANWVKVNHISDNNGLRDEHLPAGQGIFPWEMWLEKAEKHSVEFLLETQTIKDAEQSVDFLGKIK